MSNKIWLYNCVGYASDYRLFVKEFKAKLTELSNDQSKEFYLLGDGINVWEFVAKNCYGNYAKDEEVLKNFQNIVIDFDEAAGLLCVQVYSCSDMYRPNNEEYFAKDVLRIAADLLDDPEHWIVVFTSATTRRPGNFFVKKVSVPATEEDFTITTDMYGYKPDPFGKEIPTITGYKSMLDIVSESGLQVIKEVKDSIGDSPEAMLEKVVELLTDTHLQDGLEGIVEEPYKFFELEFKSINDTVDLARDAGAYMSELKGYNSSRLYSNLPSHVNVVDEPRSNHPTTCIVYSKENPEFISTSCEIEKMVLGDEIVNELKYNVIDDNDSFFSD